MLKNAFAGALLDDVPAIHYDERMAHVTSQRNIMRHHEDGSVARCVQFQQLVHDGDLRGSVKRAGGLVGKQQFWLENATHNNGNALEHTA